MQNYKQFFKGKKITVMGLGLLGRGLGYTKFLAECGADLIVTDLKTKKQLKASIEEIKNYELKIKNSKKIKFILGEHRLEDFKNRDMIIKAAGVPLDSIYIKEAKKNGIDVEMDVSLFSKLAPNVKIIGVTGTRGKSMTTTLIYEILKKNLKDKNVYVGGNLRGLATLPLIKKVKDGDVLVCELDSWQLQGFGESKISPNISVFTSFMPDHMNYYKDDMKKYFEDKSNIFKYQKKGDVLIIRPDMKEPGSRFWQSVKHADKTALPKSTTGKFYIKKSDTNGKLIVINPKDVFDWKFNVLGSHHKENMACAVEVAKQFNIPISKIKKSVAEFKDLEGRMQLLRTYKGIKIYNDNNATTPEATIAGIEALKNAPQVGLVGLPNKSDLGANIILICGGADKGLNLNNFVKVVNKNCKAVVLLKGTGTDRLLSSKQKVVSSKFESIDLKDAVKKALAQAKRGDIILFSPAFASFGMFNNEYERNDEFIKIIKGLK